MRIIKNINENWSFTKEGETVSVNLPHTWNGKDGQDGGNDYYRGRCGYEKTLAKDDFPEGEEVFLEINGANSSADVFFNGEKIASHDGGYSTFYVRLDDIKDENILKIEVDNSPNETVYPQQADFTFYGGLYRDVSLIGVSKKHFDFGFPAGPGLKVTPLKKGAGYEIGLQAFCEGKVSFEIYDGKECIGEAKAEGKDPQAVLTIENAHLWDGIKDPYLYSARAVLYDGDEPADEVSCRFGCRSFKIDPQKGFILNGRPYILRGVARHQDRPDIGNALLPEHHKEDMGLICEMGANTIRLAHYQHDRYFYDLCDERGMIVWAEIPYISRHMEGGQENTRTQMTELICQNYNHPSIVVWGLSNEITMAQVTDGLIENHNMLNDLAHELDPTRLTTQAVFTTTSIDDPYVHVSDVVSYNHYFGWYGGTFDSYGQWFDEFHKKYPDKAIGMSEYGCEALNWHNSRPLQGDYSEEYQAIYHEEVIKQIAPRPWIWATHVWNMFDFAADGRSEGGENGMNHKGLVTFDRKYKKDAFYAYKAWLSDEPVLHICGKRYIDRVEETTKVKVYSNLEEVSLYANGQLIGAKKKGEFPFFEFDVPVFPETKIEAKAGQLIDESLIRKVDTFNEDYILKEEGMVLNWFEITEPEGYFSINDTIGDILKTLRGKIFFVKILKKIKAQLSGPKDSKKEKDPSAASNTINKATMQLAMGFTVKRAISMIGAKFTKEELLEINAKLNKIKRPKK